MLWFVICRVYCKPAAMDEGFVDRLGRLIGGKVDRGKIPSICKGKSPTLINS